MAKTTPAKKAPTTRNPAPPADVDPAGIDPAAADGLASDAELVDEPATATAGPRRGQLVCHRYHDTYENREIELYGHVVDVIRDDQADEPVTARVAWLGGGVSGPIHLDELEDVDENDDDVAVAALGG